MYCTKSHISQPQIFVNGTFLGIIGNRFFDRGKSIHNLILFLVLWKWLWKGMEFGKSSNSGGELIRWYYLCCLLLWNSTVLLVCCFKVINFPYLSCFPDSNTWNIVKIHEELCLHYTNDILLLFRKSATTFFLGCMWQSVWTLNNINIIFSELEHVLNPFIIHVTQ